MLKRMLVFVVALTTMAVVSAETDARGPHELVVETTDKVTQVIKEARSYVDKNPEKFYNKVEDIMENVVDFQSFARGVMGRYGSRSYYDSLETEAEKEKFREQVQRFTETFKERLIRTYAKGLLAFNGNRIEVLPLAEDADLSGSVVVEQHIYGNAPQPYVVFYKLRQNRDGEWRLRNVSIEGINLGRTYQSQFTAAVQRYDGDIDKVIDNWSVEPAEVQEIANKNEG